MAEYFRPPEIKTASPSGEIQRLIPWIGRNGHPTQKPRTTRIELGVDHRKVQVPSIGLAGVYNYSVSQAVVPFRVSLWRSVIVPANNEPWRKPMDRIGPFAVAGHRPRRNR